MSIVDTYPCPACGGVADESTGCRDCGRPHDPEAAALAKLNQRLAGLERESRRLAGDQSELRTERARLQAEAEALKSSLIRQLTLEANARMPTQRSPEPEPNTPAPQSGPSTQQPSPLAPQPSPPTSGISPTPSAGPTPPRQRAAHSTPPPDVPETSPRSAQNTMLTLGGVLLGIAAVVVTGLFYTTSATEGRAVVLGVATLLALSVPLLLTRRTLTATAETIAAFGLLLVLLDGYAAYNANLTGLLRGVSLTLFSAVLFGLVAAVAAAYRLASHLRAPQFAALLAVQPFLPLIAAHLELDSDGFGAVFAVVAALNLASVELLSRDISRAIARVRLPGAAPGPGGQTWPRLLRELAWILFGATLAVSVALAVIGLAQANTVDAAVRSALVLLLAAAVGVVGGRMSGRPQFALLSGAAAALAIIGSVSRVTALALPEYTVVLTAAVAAAIALGSGLLPASARLGPQLGSLLGAALTGIVVAVTVAQSVVAGIRASVRPAVWAADIAALPGQSHIADWQVPAAAVLIAIVGVAAASPGWRRDAVVGGAFVVTLAVPGTGALPWWAVPLVAWAVSTVVICMALAARTGRSAVVHLGAAGLLGLYSLATSLPRAELTGAVSTLLVLVAAGMVVVGSSWPDRFGPYAGRVADSAGGAAAFTLPIAIGTFAWLVGAPGSVLVPLTLLAIAIGVFTAALAQAVARSPRTASAGGALAASAGGLLLALQADGAELADLGVAVLLSGAAAVTMVSRGFEVSSTVIGSDESPRRRRLLPIDARTAGAAIATAALIIAMARVAAVGVPGIGLVTTTAMVLVVSLVVLLLPEAWRFGPRVGAGVVGGTIVATTAGIAVIEATRTLAASTPYWHADLAGWSARVGSVAPYGWQVPSSLLLSAAAAWALLPRPTGGDIAFVSVSLAGLAIPAVAHGPWWSPPLIAGTFALLAGVGAAVVTQSDLPGTHRRRLGLAAVLMLYATAAAGTTSASTAIVLIGIVAAGVLVAGIARIRGTAPLSVAGVAAAAALAAGPGAAATTAAAGGASRAGVLGAALVMATVGVLVVGGLRLAGASWRGYAAFGVGIAALIVAGAAAVPDPAQASVWAATAALVATAAAAVARSHARKGPFHTDFRMEGTRPHDGDAESPDQSRSSHRMTALNLLTTAIPAALLAAAVSTPAWLTALVGPYRTLRQVWAGYAITPVPQGAETAVLTLVLLAAVAAGTAWTLGGGRYVLAAILPPIAAAALVLPTALGAAREATPWVALAVALATGLGAALSPPIQPSATTLLRGTAGLVCAMTGGAGLAGSLATRGATLAALGLVATAALLAAALGRDPAARAVAWIVFSAAGFALPPTALAAAGRDVRPAAFGVLALCGLLVAIAWALARSSRRRTEADVVELGALLGAGFSLLLVLGSIPYTAAVVTICGVLLGAAVLRSDRSTRRRYWLVRAALGAELSACWLLLYDVQIGLTEAYTVPFAAVALLTGALELRRRHDLSSWLAYGPALAGGFLPSVALIIVGADPVWRWVSVFLIAVATVIIGSWRGRQAPAVTGAAVVMVVAVVEMIRLLLAGAIAGALLVALAGVVLIVFGAISERRRRGVRDMS